MLNAQLTQLLTDERSRLQRKITAIDTLLEGEKKAAFLGEPGEPEPEPTMLAEALARDAKAASRAAPKKSRYTGKGRKMSVAVRAKIRKTQKARWAKIRAGKKA